MTRPVGVLTCLAFKGANRVNVLGGKVTRLRHGSVPRGNWRRW